MKIYRREDAFEVHDALDRGVSWAEETYGGNFIEVDIPILPDTNRSIEDAEARKAEKIGILNRLGLTEEEFNVLLGR